MIGDNQANSDGPKALDIAPLGNAFPFGWPDPYVSPGKKLGRGRHERSSLSNVQRQDCQERKTQDRRIATAS